MTPVDLDAIERALAAATPGPWREEHPGTGTWIVGPGGVDLGALQLFEAVDICRGALPADAHLIVNAPAWLAALVAAHREHAAEIARLRAELAGPGPGLRDPDAE